MPEPMEQNVFYLFPQERYTDRGLLMWKLTQKNTAVMWIICLCVPVILLGKEQPKLCAVRIPVNMDWIP